MVNQNIFRKTIKPYLYHQNSNQNLHTSQTTRLSGNTKKHTQGETFLPCAVYWPVATLFLHDKPPDYCTWQASPHIDNMLGQTYP